MIQTNQEYIDDMTVRLKALGVNIDVVEVYPGWWLLLEGWIIAMKALFPDFSGANITQVKQKFGQLQIYTSTEYVFSDVKYDLDNLLGYEALRTCEICAAPATKIASRGSPTSMCDSCYLALVKGGYVDSVHVHDI